MRRLFGLIFSAMKHAERLWRDPTDETLTDILTRARAQLLGEPVAAAKHAKPLLPETLPNPDGTALAAEVETLTGMMLEIDKLSAALPTDARPLGIAARSLVERSLEECRKPIINATKLAVDMQQVGLLALAMRERLLLSPKTRKASPLN